MTMPPVLSMPMASVAPTTHAWIATHVAVHVLRRATLCVLTSEYNTSEAENNECHHSKYFRLHSRIPP